MNVLTEQYLQFRAPTVGLATQSLQGRWATAALIVLCSQLCLSLCSLLPFQQKQISLCALQRGEPASRGYGSHIGHLLLLDSDPFAPSPQHSEEVCPPASPDRPFQPWEGTGHCFTLPFEMSTKILCILRAESGSTTSGLLLSPRKEARIPPSPESFPAAACCPQRQRDLGEKTSLKGILQVFINHQCLHSARYSISWHLIFTYIFKN